MKLEVGRLVAGVASLSNVFSPFVLDGPGVPLNPQSERPHKKAGLSPHSDRRALGTEKPIKGIWGE